MSTSTLLILLNTLTGSIFCLIIAVAAVTISYLLTSRQYKSQLEQYIESNKFLTAVINAIGEPIIALDTEERVIVLNYETEKLTGLKLNKQLTSQHLLKALQLDQQCGITTIPGKPDSSNITLELKGKEKTYHRNKIRITDENNTRTGCLIHYRDFTEATEAINNSKLLSSRYTDSFSNSPAAMAIIRLADGKLVDCNSSFEFLTGHSKPYFVTEVNATKQLFNSSNQLKEILQLVRDNRQLYNIEIPLINSRGETCITLGSFEAVENKSENCMFATFLDITDWKKTEQALIDSENFAYSALDSLSNQIAVLDNSACLIYTNTAWKSECTTLFALNNCCEHGTDLINEWENTTELSNENIIKLKDAICKVSTGVISKVSYEFTNVIHNDISSYICKINRFLHGNQTRIMISIEDISDLRKAENEKRRTENKYKSIFKNLTEGVFQCDEEGKLITMNPSMVSILGITSEAETPTGNNYLSNVLCFGETNEQFLQLLKSEDAIKGLIFQVPVLQNKSVQILLKARTITYDNHSYIEGTIEDITERKAAEEALRTSEFTLRTIFENTIQSFILLDPNYKILKWNHKAEETIRKTTGLQINCSEDVNTYLPKKFLKGFHDLITEVGTEKQLSKQFKFREINGAESWVEINMCTYESDLHQLGYIITATDITNAKAAGDKINTQISMLQKTNLELDRFVYSVTHDLRAPLTSILGVINIAMFESNSPGMIKHLEMIRTCVNRLDEFIQNILNYSRNSRQGLCIREINFRQLLTETRNNLKYLNGEQRIRIVSEINENETFFSDSTRISVLLNNLLSNAVKYSDPSKKDSFIEVKITTKSSGCELLIIDNGLGISSEYQHKVFEMFYRIYQNIPGSGIGLYIVKETVNKLKGSIQLTSEEGKGCEFKIQLPNLTKQMKLKLQTNEIEN